MKRVVAIVGLSGVGKSTLVRRLQGRLPLLHLQASELIKAEQARRFLNAPSSEELRVGPVIDNQQLLIDGFNAATAGISGLVVFDGHAVVFRQESTIEIPTAVFGALGCAAIVAVEADPAIIRLQRLRDEARVRPEINEADLRRHQDYSNDVAERIAAELRIPFRRVAAADFDQLAAAIAAAPFSPGYPSLPHNLS